MAGIVCKFLITMFIGAVVVALAASVLGRPDPADARQDGVSHMHSHVRSRRSAQANGTRDEENYADYWIRQGQLTLNAKLLVKQNTNVAKNVIMFLGDGMSIPTIKAARVYMGQRENKTGEDSQLTFEKFPHVGLSKTYCVDRQVPDSACTATAYLCGVKANEATIGVTAKVQHNDCKANQDETAFVTSIGRWSQLKGKRTGIVTSTRITHASPAGVYAHTANRDWESSADSPPGCKDIAHQLVYGETGKNLNVILGGGRREFLPNTTTDEEGSPGRRTDGTNLIEEWLHGKRGQRAEYVWNRTALLDVSNATDYLLGLFEPDHCQYHLDADPETEPTLAEMTESAIKILSNSEKGFFLFVEGGRIDHAHHDNRAQKALDETVEFSKAVQVAVEQTHRDDTLIVVTSDHAHVMTVSGYAERGNDILGVAGTGSDGKPYATLSYANGPSYKAEVDGVRRDLTHDDMRNKSYQFPAMVPLESETHGGDDVGIFAVGPWAHLFTGVIEQNVIPHIMAFASCVGKGVTVCDQEIRK